MDEGIKKLFVRGFDTNTFPTHLRTLEVPLYQFKANTMNAKLTNIEQKIKGLAPEKETFFTTSQLCKYLGKSRSAIHGYKKKGLIPYTKIGGRYRFSKSEIDQAVHRQSII